MFYWRKFALALSFVFALSAGQASAKAPIHALSSSERAAAEKQNEFARRNPRSDEERSKVFRPYAEYETAGYVIFSDADDYNSGTIRREIAKNLPSDMQLVVLSRTESQAAEARTYFSNFISPSRLHSVVTPVGDTFWARDSSPEPVFIGTAQNPKLGLVETRHRNGDKIARQVGPFFSAPVTRSDYAYPGGNFLADRNGNCFAVQDIYPPEAEIKRLYGCKTVTLFPRAHGIGHVDETLKILSDTEALTDVPQYAEVLQELGFRVSILPRPRGNSNGTYANSLLVNGTVFLPVYGVPEDQTAIEMYRSYGLRVVPLRSNSLSEYGLGSIHCITMSYPPTDLAKLLSAFR